MHRMLSNCVAHARDSRMLPWVMTRASPYCCLGTEKLACETRLRAFSNNSFLGIPGEVL